MEQGVFDIQRRQRADAYKHCMLPHTRIVGYPRAWACFHWVSERISQNSQSLEPSPIPGYFVTTWYTVRIILPGDCKIPIRILYGYHVHIIYGYYIWIIYGYHIRIIYWFYIQMIYGYHVKIGYHIWILYGYYHIWILNRFCIWIVYDTSGYYMDIISKYYTETYLRDPMRVHQWPNTMSGVASWRTLRNIILR